MTRTAIRHTMFALATASLLIAFTGLTAYAQSATPFMGMKGAAITSAAISGSQPQPPQGLAAKTASKRVQLILNSFSDGITANAQKTPKGLTTRKGSRQTGAVLPHPIRDYALSANNSR